MNNAPKDYIPPFGSVPSGPNLTDPSPTQSPTPEIVARIAEFLSLAVGNGAPDPAAMLRVAQDLDRCRAQAEQLARQIAMLEMEQRLMQEAAARAEPVLLRLNQLALHLAMELPLGLWRAVCAPFRHPKGGPDIIERLYGSIDAARGALGTEGQITGGDKFWASPGIGRPPEPQKP